jgi:hypothetical protein
LHKIAELLSEHTSASAGSGINIWFRFRKIHELWPICRAPAVALRALKAHLNSGSSGGTENRVAFPSAVKFAWEEFVSY